jgi:Malate synthase, N-terminal domain
MSDLRMNTAPADFNAETDLPAGFMDFLLPLHRALTPRRRALIDRRAESLAASHRGQAPDHLPPSEATTGDWRIDLPDWCQDQRIVRRRIEPHSARTAGGRAA